MSLKLKEYVGNLVKVLKDNPEYGTLDVICSRDDEGNGFQNVYYGPGLGHHDGEYHGEFTQFNPEAEHEEDTCTKEEINAICIN